ncbi:prolyl-tRNA editing enzyme YbaK/EbsC (Cys-tRNA(Pro) deacylase) [Conyzicola lurida]|uniref:Prolyl-tRNA editing enzyme YbaK/EbsC (Cys-tRNA(Pro) deacylase) n=1 Tax=Conyzicola lurida TaxID=1172621 RepID=A0A841AJT7_9MICO|nr:prolyl-tRNA editing enzyme YbaK/EbsC (Cys-tRNA(Pro) deacylase) [Conyzicola lurida]
MPEHPAVVRVEAALVEAGVETQVVWLDGAAKTAVEAASALGISVGAIANSLVFLLDGEPALIMTSGAHRVDTAWLGERVGGEFSRADATTVKTATGQVIGGIAPVGHPAPLRTFVDEALAEFPEIWAAAGHAHTVFPLSFDELVRITGGTVTPVAPAASPAD